MGIETAIYSKLAADTVVAALVAARVYNTRLPQDPTYPAVVFARVSTGEDMVHDGPAGYEIARFQIDSYATTFSAVRSLADAVRDCLNGLKETIGGVVVHAVMLDNEFSDWGDLLDIWRITQDYMVHWRRT